MRCCRIRTYLILNHTSKWWVLSRSMLLSWLWWRTRNHSLRGSISWRRSSRALSSSRTAAQSPRSTRVSSTTSAVTRLSCSRNFTTRCIRRSVSQMTRSFSPHTRPMNRENNFLNILMRFWPRDRTASSLNSPQARPTNAISPMRNQTPSTHGMLSKSTKWTKRCKTSQPREWREQPRLCPQWRSRW